MDHLKLPGLNVAIKELHTVTLRAIYSLLLALLHP